ncbi:MAG TPA: serine protease [Bacteriovoracaceae bacterium]|nr:serine protease [Bacteriovoracaceae bacterium]
MKISTTLVLAVSLLSAGQALAKNKVIYGEDNRVDVVNSNNSLFVELSRSTAAMISSVNLRPDEDAGTTRIVGKTLRSSGICATERFANQISAANCSGFLVGENLLVTAGHCIRNNSDCRGYKWVFDYKVDHEDQGEVVVDSTSIYSCKRIVNRSLNSMNGDDWALLELDRNVTDRAPLTYRTSGKPRVQDPLVVIGHPTGIPTKIADGANVRSLSSTYFVANLDTFGGNSGSAVFNAHTGVVEGILVRGTTDYVYNRELKCQVSNVCTNSGCRGEDVTYITNIPELQ